MEQKDVRILIVEDTAGARNLALRMLTSLGYKATAAKDASEAINLIVQGEQFDVIFTDILMPGPMNGIALAREVREHIPSIKILFTSGFQTMPPEEIVELDASFVGKPYRRTEIANILQLMLRSI
jgi:CheY-like chemotaxis protein